MPINVSYMGTKRRIAPVVAELVSRSRGGPVLDLFSGMCAVGSAVADSRQVWTNDKQLFSASVATAHFSCIELPIIAEDAIELTRPIYLKNLDKLKTRFESELRDEDSALDSRGIPKIAALSSDLPNTQNSFDLELERKRLAGKPSTFPYRLFTITHAGGYLGLYQCMQIDSIRYSIDQLLVDETTTIDQHRWLILGLAKAMYRCSATTGHFAQFLKIKGSNKERFLRSRRMSVWREWLAALYELGPIGSKKWRSKNKSFNMDAIELLKSLRMEDETPSVIYADPPYTGDQYSRYYHLYETLILYDYPKTDGVGRYRESRFQSQFSTKSKVRDAFRELIDSTAEIGAELILSYPWNGLLEDARSALLKMLKNAFDAVEISHTIDHLHSSMGASNGKEKHAVTELIFWAR